jgi:hypothetical protein
VSALRADYVRHCLLRINEIERRRPDLQSERSSQLLLRAKV